MNSKQRRKFIRNGESMKVSNFILNTFSSRHSYDRETFVVFLQTLNKTAIDRIYDAMIDIEYGGFVEDAILNEVERRAEVILLYPTDAQ